MNLLVTWLWQGLLVAAVAAAIVRACRRVNAATRCRLWWAALLAIGLVPIVSPVRAFVHAAIEPATHATAIVLGAHAPDPSPGLALPLPPFWLLVTLLAAWMALVMMRLTQIVYSLAVMARVKRDSQPLDPVREDGLARWQDARRLGRRCDLRVSDRVPDACVVGLRRPAILLSPALLQALSDEELDQVVLHEHAHVVRNDDWSRLAQCLLATMLGVHPAVWAINRHIDLEREAACDDRVVARTRAAREYAACLARVAAVRLAGSPCGSLVVPAAARSRRLLRARIIRLVDRETPATAHLGWISTTLGLAALGAAMIGAGLMPAPITFMPRAAAVLEALPAAGLHWHAARPSGRAGEQTSPVAAIEIAHASPVTTTEPRTPPPADDPKDTPSTEDLPDDVASADPRPALLMPMVEDAPATAVSPLASYTIGSDVLPASLEPLPARPTASQPAGHAFSLPDGSAFSAFGDHAARAGVALGTHLQQMGGNLGGWFTRVARGISPP
jgi:beta-lactamase regulating signal transducer with metallopeptidase domain